MKKILTGIFFVIFILIGFVVYQLNFANGQIQLSGADIFLISSDEDYFCEESELAHAEGLCINLNYKSVYEKNIRIFNSFTGTYTYKLDSIENIQIVLTKGNVQKIRIDSMLSNAIFEEYLYKYLCSGKNMVYSEKVDEDKKYTLLDDLISTSTDIKTLMARASKSGIVFNKDVLEFLEEREKFEILNYLPERSPPRGRYSQMVYCRNAQPGPIAVDLSYTGDLDFFIMLLNARLINADTENLIPSIILKIPSSILSKYKDIDGIELLIKTVSGQTISTEKKLFLD